MTRKKHRNLTVGVIGVGYWGPNFVRNFIRHERIHLKWICDLNLQALSEIKHYYPHLNTTSDYTDLLNDPDVEFIMIATPPESHFKIAKSVLKANKHLIVAKPLTTKSVQAKELLKIARKNKLLLHGDLTYLYTGSIKYIKKFVQNGKLGNPMYYDSTRTNLGLIQKEVNVIWDLAPHDLAILEYCFELKPISVFATASKHYGNNKNFEMAHITVNYSRNFIAHIHVSWVSPIKLRTVLIGGSKKMIFFDDIQPDEKIKIYDKGVDISTEDITYMKPVYRIGDALIPKLINEEAIFTEIAELTEQILSKKINYTNAQLNIRIIKLLEACDKSILTGKPVIIKPDNTL